ncbi:unnamed protein product [Coregonus sp. 'balchen']|nr:unnamed protein product [Coregonus sp. 'balchen']
MSEDQEAQEDELLALASIYDEEEFRRAESAQGGEIQLCLELPPSFKLIVNGKAETSRTNMTYLSYLLWCLTLYFLLTTLLPHLRSIH